jgi:hypothetical protein
MVKLKVCILNDQMSFECTTTIIFVLYCYVLI